MGRRVDIIRTRERCELHKLLPRRCGADAEREPVPVTRDAQRPLSDAQRPIAKGNRNALKHGRYAAEALAGRREVAALLRELRALAKMPEE